MAARAGVKNPLGTEARRSSKQPDSRSDPSPSIKPVSAFYVFLAANFIAAAFAPIQDCDEVFNYWEPTHYLNHGYGLQTWEYSPDYAIRSWAYTISHASVIWIGSLLPFINSKRAEFYLLRAILACVCAACETRLYSAIARNLNPKVAVFFLMVMIFSPGMYHASPAYLPSSFAMYTTMLGFSAFMDWQGGIKTAQGIFWFAVGSLLGWPFAGALILPFLFEEVLLAAFSGKILDGFMRLLDGTVRSVIVLAIQTAIDTFFYKKLVCVPFNIVLYNVFSGGSKGPNIYGVEPWHFYVRNLILNFNIWFLLALGALPLLLFQHLIRQRSVSMQTLLRGTVFVSPFYLWLAIFTLQPHKEERFMYPAYPALALNAAMSLHILLANFGSNDPRDLVSKIPAQLKLAIVSIFVLGSIDLGVLRTMGMMTAYSAPLNVYGPLQNPAIARPGDNVCLGKEWYRFPSTYFLPDGIRAKFIKSEFSGLLPGEFSEATDVHGLFPGAWLPPSGMNDENREDPGKYVNIEQCQFLVDSQLPGVPSTALEPDYISDTEKWEKLSCTDFLDTTRTSTLGRLIWVPDWPFVPERFRRKWGRYCLLRRKSVKQTSHLWKSTRKIWYPLDFKRPAAPPYPDWSVTDTKPLPYRPFRYGPKYNVTMGLRTMHWDEWIELDNRFLEYHELKAKRIEERGKKCSYTSPEAFDGACELLEELCDYLPQRYPSLYRKTEVGMDNLVTGETFDIVERPLKEDPMQMAARFTQDDLAIMFEKEDGQYYLLAGSILLAGFWRLEDKLGMPLSEIHTSGNVPQYKEKLEKGMMNFFRRVQPGHPVVRNNYFIQVDDQLPWSPSIGSEDSEGIGWFTAEKNKAIQHHYFRSERQSLRRLPRSGGVVFTIRTYFHPITDICKEQYVPGRLASAVRSWGDDVSRYKGKDRYHEVLLEYLDKAHERQLANGLDMSKEEEVRYYPF
ncbi:glycosyltransferase family 22 protein [Aaosphaeria arxii CBS 175.79]|uniref:Mannosyltransferase n=1 Tax=Aaosphaeria arxii CBS 175.79 TaxID=1450172 RepID=A0A6A5XGV4_9PLEO|nr:glycosyltransferase family 22 protein [Aaosphaeria arxii CBS 175.79]KAF2012163.1 glycosyltransferase family 22 protein [Aaosphaeria arxii CBS 175.79]